MRFILFCALVLLTPLATQAQNSNPLMDRARAGLVQNLNKIAQWQVTHVTDQTVMQCTSCLKPVTVVLRHMADYTKDSGFSNSAKLYLAGRAAHCQALVSEGVGRCTSIKDRSAAAIRPSITAHSIEGDRKVFEFVMPSNGVLLAGYVEAHEQTENLAAIQNALTDAVRRLHPAW